MSEPCPAWADGVHCFVPVTVMGNGYRAIPEGPHLVTDKACACGAIVELNEGALDRYFYKDGKPSEGDAVPRGGSGGDDAAPTPGEPAEPTAGHDLP